MTLEYQVSLALNPTEAQRHLNRVARQGWRLATAFPMTDLGVTDRICLITERVAASDSDGG